MTTTWDPSNLSAVTLSGSNLVATSTAANGGVRGADGLTSGQYYFEVTLGSTFSGIYVLGIGNGNANVTTVGTGGAPGGDACAYVNYTGNIYLAGNNQSLSIGSPTAGSVIGIAVDLTNCLIWFRLAASGNWNGSSSNNPSTGVGGLMFRTLSTGPAFNYYPIVGFGASGNSVTANFGASGFTGAVPSGYTSGWPSGSGAAASAAVAAQVLVEHWAVLNPSAELTQVAIEEWAAGSPSAELTQIAAEVWQQDGPSVQLTQLAIEVWQSPAGSVSHSGTYSYVIPAGRAGVPSVAAKETTQKTFVIAAPAVLTESNVVAPGSASLSDAAVVTESYTLLDQIFAALSDSVASSDVFLSVVSLADSGTLVDIFTFPENYPEALTDSAASSDSYPEPILMLYGPLDDHTATSDAYAVQTAFLPSLSDVASSFDVWNGIVTTIVQPECGPIALFPSLPEGYPVKLSLVLDTIVGTTKSLREMRYAQQIIPLWDIEVPFEELIDQTQNQTPFAPFAGTAQYMQLVELFLMMYGKTGVFAFNAPWDNSRTNQIITTNSASGQTAFPVFETWGSTGVATEFPVGMINQVTTVYVNGVAQSPSTYVVTRSYINFSSPPAAGSTVSLTFSFYYLCRFTEDEQDFDEFSKNRWQVPSLKFRAVYWPGCQ